jgi:hypothetical protein
MIHLLEVSPTISPQQLKKLSRKYAMTGGFELALKQDLSATELELMSKIYIQELLENKKNSPQYSDSKCKSSNAFRILKLIIDHVNVSEESKLDIAKALDLK